MPGSSAAEQAAKKKYDDLMLAAMILNENTCTLDLLERLHFEAEETAWMEFENAQNVPEPNRRDARETLKKLFKVTVPFNLPKEANF